MNWSPWANSWSRIRAAGVLSGAPFSWVTRYREAARTSGVASMPPLGELATSAARGVTIPWTLVASAILGVWLMFSRLIFASEPPMADSDHLVGALIVTVAVIAMAEVARPLRFYQCGFRPVADRGTVVSRRGRRDRDDRQHRRWPSADRAQPPARDSQQGALWRLGSLDSLTGGARSRQTSIVRSEVVMAMSFALHIHVADVRAVSSRRD